MVLIIKEPGERGNKKLLVNIKKDNKKQNRMRKKKQREKLYTNGLHEEKKKFDRILVAIFPKITIAVKLSQLILYLNDILI